LIAEASQPKTPVAPDRVRIGLVALVFGLMLGVGVALAVEYTDNSLRTVEDIHRVVPGLRVVGVIPVVRDWKSRDEAFVVSVRAPTSPAAEAMRTLRTSLAFLSLENDVNVLQVTSADAGEGKSSTVANLGVALARAGRRVVVIDCDLRRPRLHRFFELDGGVGLTSILAGEADLAAAVRPAPSVPRLMVLPAGPLPADPSELLSSQRMADVVDALRAQGAMVILDCPPVLPLADALAAAPLADATVIVCRAGQSDAKRLARCVDLLRQVRAPLAGIVLNAAPGEAAYGAGYAYGQTDAPGTRRAVTERGA
jgi:capsular exopolysaccharide synthesis family protein